MSDPAHHDATDRGVPIVSADSDFARFTELTWIDPLS